VAACATDLDDELAAVVKAEEVRKPAWALKSLTSMESVTVESGPLYQTRRHLLGRYELVYRSYF
jgi:hypothetical protein